MPIAHLLPFSSFQLGRLLARFLTFPTPNTVLDPCLADIRSFATSSTYMDRQLYLRMLEGFIGLIPQELFEELLEHAAPLASDKTSNVRLACVVTMKVLLTHAAIHASPAATKIVATLSSDSHKDVQRRMRDAVQAASGHAAATTALTTSLSTLALAPSSASSVSLSELDTSDALTDADLDDILDGPPAAASPPSVEVPSPSSASATGPITPPGGAHVLLSGGGSDAHILPLAPHSIDEVSPPSQAATSEVLLGDANHDATDAPVDEPNRSDEDHTHTNDDTQVDE